jgi:NAD-dependent dihydropyrimidine dehydrogenase PreA subunit
VDAISEGADKYQIDPDTCVDCGACVGECPVDAIAPE